MFRIKFLWIGIALLSLLRDASGFVVTIDAHAEECFFERVEAGSKMSMHLFSMPQVCRESTWHGNIHYRCHVWSYRRRLPWYRRQDHRSHVERYLLGRKGVLRQIHVCRSHVWFAHSLLRQPNVFRGAESGDVLDRCWRCTTRNTGRTGRGGGRTHEARGHDQGAVGTIDWS